MFKVYDFILFFSLECVAREIMNGLLYSIVHTNFGGLGDYLVVLNPVTVELLVV